MKFTLLPASLTQIKETNTQQVNMFSGAGPEVHIDKYEHLTDVVKLETHMNTDV